MALANPPLDDRFHEAVALVDARDLTEGIVRLEALLVEVDSPGLETDVHRWLAHAYTLQGDPERALPHIDAGIASEPADPWLRYARGTALHTMGRFEEAIQSYSRAIERDPLHIKSWEWRGATHALAGEYGDAIGDLTRALEIAEDADPAELAAWHGERRVLLREILGERARAYDALGLGAAARADREGLDALLRDGD